jgi:ankyrin repeat protein
MTNLFNSKTIATLFLIVLAIISLVWASYELAIFRLWNAIEREQLSYIQDYAQKGKDLNRRHLITGETALFYAMKENKRNSFQTLLDCGANPNGIARGGKTVVHFAANEPDSFWLDLVLRAGGDPNLYDSRRGSFPLAYAMFEGRLNNVKLLCESGADIDAPDRYGRTPLTLASDAAEFEILYYLLEQGADYRKVTQPGFTFFDSFRQKTPEVYQRSSPENAQWCRAARKWLKERDADPDRARWDGRKWVFDAGDAENDGT